MTLPATSPGETFRTLLLPWEAARPPRGAPCDGWDFAREPAFSDRLPEPAMSELAARDVRSRHEGRREPRPGGRRRRGRSREGGWSVRPGSARA